MNGVENRRGNLCETVARGGDTQRFARVVVMDFQNVSSSSVGCSRCCGDPTNVDSASTVVAVGARRGGQSCVGEGNQFCWDGSWLYATYHLLVAFFAASSSTLLRLILLVRGVKYVAASSPAVTSR